MASTWLPKTLLALMLALPAVASASKGSIYCCQAANGQSVCGDPLPQACYGREYREMSPRGTVLRVIAAPLSAEERSRQDAEKRRLADEEVEREKQRRLDTALLETYRSPADIDARETRALADIDKSIGEIRQRLGELDEEQVKLDALLSSMSPDQVTTRHRLARSDIDNERATYQRLLVARQNEREAVRKQYAQDRRRYAELLAEGRTRP